MWCRSATPSSSRLRATIRSCSLLGDEGKTYAAVAVLGLSASENLLHGEGQSEQGRAKGPPDLCGEIVSRRRAGRSEVRRLRAAQREVEGRRAAARGIRGRPRAHARDVRAPRRLRPARAFQHAGDAEEGEGRRRDADDRHASRGGKETREPRRRATEEPDAQGYLARIYLHLLSLENFARLLDRKATRPAAA
jgi:hypothetical protein